MCAEAGNTGLDSYPTLLHEVGHAPGIGYGDDGMSPDRHHPKIRESVLSYISERGYNCSPHPFDVMAIFALYQRVPK